MNPIQKTVLRVLAAAQGPMVSTKLVKLVYLADYVHFQHFGRTITGLRYQWSHYGPNALGHAIVSEARGLADSQIVRITESSNEYEGITSYSAIGPNPPDVTLAPSEETVLRDVFAQFGSLSWQELTAVSKRTEPFRRVEQYDLIEMEQSAPAEFGAAEDWEAYVRDLQEEGLVELDEVKQRYGIA